MPVAVREYLEGSEDIASAPLVYVDRLAIETLSGEV